jgi:hypothetical protein
MVLIGGVPFSLWYFFVSRQPSWRPAKAITVPNTADTVTPVIALPWT